MTLVREKLELPNGGKKLFIAFRCVNFVQEVMRQ